MIAGAIAGLTLVVAVSANQSALAPSGLGPSEANLSSAQKNAAIRPLVRSATECIIKTVSGDPRFATAVGDGTLGDLIVDSMTICVQPVRAMINAHDRYFGEGTGEAFFMGPYLDVLPRTVVKSAQGVAE
jgi:hypothetical protein